jgi:hypothetical protein
MEQLLSARGLSAEIAAETGVVRGARRKSIAVGTVAPAESTGADGTGAEVAPGRGSAGKSAY